MNEILTAIQQLEKGGQYKVLERLDAPQAYHQGNPQTPRIGIVLDTETTGLDTSKDKIIELGFIAFHYDAGTGAIYDILQRYGGFEDPKEPLTEIVKQVTGITDDMLIGQSLDETKIVHWLNKSSLIIAHNAAFDRQMLERRLPQISDSNWACTLNDIHWQDENITSLKLDYIAYKLGYFFEGHRAVNDAEATLHLLSKTLPNSGKLAMSELLNHARVQSRRYFAVGAPFDKKDDLKERGYRWLADYAYTDQYGKTKKGVWSKAIHQEETKEEEIWLQDNIYSGQKTVFTYNDLTANNRYSMQEFK
ncbi:3'-5' exonuclease [Ghiorsea bivora]|uniref:3'-5' exonuclease n=1 Tax=Ghiorsea bivora TaxID=1485545 RepID=UPI00056E6585|nr:3'-5' exonuclease [Ghiorsea bivora]